jgi:hypothetical protein
VLEIFSTLQEVLEAEILLHEFYQVDKNPHFANIVRATTTGFYYSASGKDNPFYGRKHTEKSKELVRSKNKGRKQDKYVVERRTKTALKYKYLFISPDNERYEVDNANQFCISNNLNSSAASQVARGNWSNHSGWKVIRITKDLNFTEEIIQEHLRVLRSIEEGEKRIGRKDTEETKRKKSLASEGKKKSKESIEKRTNSFCKYIWTFISPQGIVYESYNCNELCRELNLCQVGMGRVARGDRPHYKGWKISRRPRTNKDK